MGKQDWNAGETLSRSNLNRPFCLASGVYNAGDTQLELYISGGRLRMPWMAGTDSPGSVTYSGQTQRLIVDNPAADTAYTIFVRPGGSDARVPRFMVSGASLANFSAGQVDSPRFDAEPIGTVYTGASLSTANLRGPWNAGAFEFWDERSEMAPVMSSRPRAMYRQGSQGNAALNYTNSVTVSGIAHLHFRNPEVGQRRTYIAATVRYLASGALTAGALYVAPTFSIYPFSSVQGIEGKQTHLFTVAQNPDDAVTRGAKQIQTTTVVGMTRGAGSGLGLSLWAGFDGTATDSAVSPGIRIQEFEFVAIPGLYALNTFDPSLND